MQDAPSNSAGVSVAICCYNSASRLAPTLAHLAAQESPGGLPWEVLVIDNASTDATAEVARAAWPAGAAARLRVVAEPRSGLQFARGRALTEAAFGILSFIDDDNWVCRDWVRLVAEIMADRPGVGACGGISEAECEIPPPAWFSENSHCYAVGAQGFPDALKAGPRPCLWGAGLTIRRAAWEALVRDGFRSTATDRFGGSLSSGGDSEMCHALRLAGWELWYDPRLRLTHFIPADRLRWGYLRRLSRGFGAALMDPYWFVLDDRMRALPAWRRSWCMAVLREIRAAPSWLPGWYRGRGGAQRGEGDPRVLHAERALGRLGALLRTPRRYGASCQAVLDARWWRNTLPASGRDGI